MFLAFVTNSWNHHIAPLATALHAQLGGDDFRMILTEDVSLEQRRLGYAGGENAPPWVVQPPKNEEERRGHEVLCMEADVAAMSYGPIARRVESGKLTLVMSERWWKSLWHYLLMLYPRYVKNMRGQVALSHRPNAHALAIGYYAPRDLRSLGAYRDRIWNWGYFVDVNPEAPDDAADRPLKLLWVGRMLGWKRCDLIIRALRRIQGAPWFGGCRIVGEGEEKARLTRLAERLALDPARVSFQPPVPFQEVRALMRESDVYVLPSNRMEGWGAVVGEAMSEGCVVVANQEAGASRVLIENERTGLLFRDGDAAHLAVQLARLGTDGELRRRLRGQAWERMHALWDPAVGARRLIDLCRGLLEVSPMPRYSDGPCSRFQDPMERL